MVSAKLLAMVVLFLFVVAVYVIIVIQGNITGNDVMESTIKQFADAGTCSLNTLNDECSRYATDATGANCLWDDAGKPKVKCGLCEAEINGQPVYSCKLAVCGCGFGQKRTTVSVSLDDRDYKPGETMKAKGTVAVKLFEDRSNLEVKFFFTDSGGGQTTALGDSAANEEAFKTVTENKDGEYSWDYTLPTDARPGRYTLVAEYNKGRGLVEFYVVD